MVYSKFRKIFVIGLAANMLAGPVLAHPVFTGHVQAAEMETFANIHALYQHWCSNDYGNFPDNVGDVYCYYLEKEDIHYDPAVTAEAAEDALANPPAMETTSDSQDIIEVAADQDYVLIIGLVKDTPEAEQEILSQLSDQSHVAFASCPYSYKELKSVHKEIEQMMAEEGICGVGSTCSVREYHTGMACTMENYVDVTVLPEFYEKTAAMLIENYGDKVRVYPGTVGVDNAADDIVINDDITDMRWQDDYDNLEKETHMDIGGEGVVQGPAYTDGISSTSGQKKELGFSQATTALTLNDTFTFKGNWKKTAKITWTITAKNKVKVLSKKTNGCNFKIQAKKTGYVTITAENKKNHKAVSQKILILDKNGTVTDQDRLTAALQSESIKKITIKTKGKKKFTISKGNYENSRKKLIINAPESVITVEEPEYLETMVLKKSKQIHIMGTTPEKAEKAFGKPVETLSGLAGDVFRLENGMEVVAYYDSGIDANTATGNADRPAGTVTFLGTILEIYGEGTSALVEPDEGSKIRASSDKVMVNLAINTEDNFSVGDRVEVFYNGEVAESYPAQIRTDDIRKVKETK